jgi:hypothetical protein
MKSMQGLIVAIALGLSGAMLNWFYLEQRSRDFDKVSFIGIQEGASIKRGDPLREDQLVPVEIPQNAVGQLQNFAYYYKDLATVVGQSPARAYTGGELLLRQDMKTPPSELKLSGANHRAMWIPVDTSTIVPSLIVPGDQVDFLVSESQSRGVPTPAVPEGDEPVRETPPPVTRRNSEIIGPFTVLSLGNRLGTAAVMQAAHVPQTQENVMTILVEVQGNQLEPKAQKLWDMLQKSNFRQAGVLLHPRSEGQ